MEKMLWAGCEVHQFDPSPRRESASGQVLQHRIWIDWRGPRGGVPNRPGNGLPRRLSAIMDALGHREVINSPSDSPLLQQHFLCHREPPWQQCPLSHTCMLPAPPVGTWTPISPENRYCLTFPQGVIVSPLSQLHFIGESSQVQFGMSLPINSITALYLSYMADV